MKKIVFFLFVLVALLLSACTSSCSSPQRLLSISGLSSQEQDFARAWVFINLGDGVSGNGVVVANNEEGAVILTAAHVCLSGFPQIADIFGRRSSVRMLDIDPMTDLCLLQSDRQPSGVTGLIEVDPRPQTQIVNVCTPLGMYRSYPEHTLFRNYGTYLAESPNIEGRLLADLETASGCSGSAVYDADGRIIGIISARTSDWVRGTLLVSGKDISEFLFRNSIEIQVSDSTPNQSDYFENLP